MKNIKTVVNFRKIKNLDVEDSRNFPKAKSVLTVVRGDEANQQIWAVFAEANEVFGMFLPMGCFDNKTVNKLQQFCSRRFPLFIHSSLYKALKLTLPLDIGNLSTDDTIKTEM